MQKKKELNPLLNDLITYIKEHNSKSSNKWNIDSIRIHFSKQHKMEKLRAVGRWNKIKPNTKISYKLKDRLSKKEFTSAYQLEDKNIYYYNMQDKPLYRKAMLVIFGIHQYNQDNTSKTINYDDISILVSILKNINSIDLCFDFTTAPNIEALKRYYNVKSIISDTGLTHYINKPNITMIDKFYIYDKQLKDGLMKPLFRFEATIQIPNAKELFIPISELENILNILEVLND